MSLPFGVPAGTPILTPNGPRAVESLAPGDVVWGVDPNTLVRSPAAITGITTWETDQLQAIAFEGGSLPEVTPGTNVWDAFEEAFRAAGSLSTLSEVLVDSGAGELVTRAVLTTPETRAPGTRVYLPTLARPHGALLVAGVVVRHKEPI